MPLNEEKQKAPMPQPISPEEQLDTADETIQKPEDTFNYDKAKNNPSLMAIQFIKKQPKVITHNNDLYFWNSKCFDQLSDANIRKLIYKFYDDNKIIASYKPQNTKNIIEVMKDSHKVREVPELDNYSTLINLNNVIYSLDDNTTIQHDPRYNFSYTIDVDYDKTKTEKDHPVFTGFLEDIFRDPLTQKPDQQAIDLVLYIFAYLLYPQIKIESMFFFLGNGSNGKSVLIDVMQKFFPEKYVTNLSLNAMSQESGWREDLIHSRLNIATEQEGGAGNKVQSEEIKKFISGEAARISRRFKDSVNIRTKLKILIASNDYPFLKDNSDGMRRRLTMVNFKNKFLIPEKYMEMQKMFPNTDLASKGIYHTSSKDALIKDILNEKSAIFNTLVKYLQKLKEREWNLPATLNSTELLDEYLANADVFGTWLEDTYFFDYMMKDDEAITPTEILNEYKIHFEEHNPGSKFNLSTRGVSKKVKQLFRDGGKVVRRKTTNVNQLGMTKKTKQIRVYYLRKKDEPTTIAEAQPSQTSQHNPTAEDLWPEYFQD